MTEIVSDRASGTGHPTTAERAVAGSSDRTTASNYTAPNLTVQGRNGTAFAYRRFGRSGTTPVVFLQHFRGNLDNWDPALVDDVAAQREVILMDSSGVGLSTGSTPHTVTELARDALAFVDALGLEEIDLVGFSIGGCIAQELALLRPYLVRRLVLAGTGPRGGRGYHPWSPEVRAMANEDVQDSRHILYLFFTTSASSQAKGTEFVERIFTRRDDRDVTPALAARDAQGEALLEWAVPDPGKLARLTAITQPTLVANGDSDRMIPTPNSYLLAGHIPDARLVIYPDAGHGFLFQFPQEFAAEVNRFLSAVPANRRTS
jgi:pimeloyl-ACP methyl ester carboxylesterase